MEEALNLPSDRLLDGDDDDDDTYIRLCTYVKLYYNLFMFYMLKRRKNVLSRPQNQHFNYIKYSTYNISQNTYVHFF